MTLVSADPHTDNARARPNRVALIGGFGIGNFGNDASLEAVLALLRSERPETDIVCICTKPEVVSAKFGVEALPTVQRPRGARRWADLALLRAPSTAANWNQAMRALQGVDLLLFPGTGVFDDFNDTPLGWPSRLLRWCAAARARGVPIAFLSVGAGPILNPISRFMMKQAAAMAAYRSYRDPESKAFMLSLGVKDEDSAVAPDVAFLLPRPDDVSSAADGGKITVGVGVMKYSGWRGGEAVYQTYVERHAALIDALEARGYGVRILVGQNNDWRAVEDVERRLGRSLADAYPEPQESIHDVMRAAAATDLVVASRYHVQVAALKMGRPVISLSYAPKNDALIAAAGLNGFSQNVEDIDVARLTEQIAAMANARDRYSAIVRERVAAMEQRLKETLRRLDLL